MPTRNKLDDSRFPRLAPAEYAGQWVAWNKDQTAIIAHAKTHAALLEAIRTSGVPHGVLERVRRPDEILIGRV